ncbi:MAG: LarC family nickel insertion protein [Bacteroidia bacterium]|nr:LarC family nickel insertion protein [Bacteroidia bacterium]
MSTLYIEPFSGLSGDMILSALCSLADAGEEVIQLPGKLHLPDGKVELTSVNVNGIVCNHVKIIDLNAEKHSSASSLLQHSHHHHHAHRHLKDILEIIDKGHITDGAKTIAKAIFTLIGESEARVHNIPLEKIHFHEVSAVDSILDIVGCAVMLDKLAVTQTYCDAVCTGFGMVKTQHGILPVPAPATADLLRGMPVYKGDEEGEKVTPTGAAILCYLKPDFKPQIFSVEKIAYGPGQKRFRNPNVVRISILEESTSKKKQEHRFQVVK